MLSFFRSFTKSRYGVIVVFAVLAIIAIAFALGDITGIRSSATGSGDVVAKVGNVKITDREVRDRIDRFLRELQEQGQSVTIADFIKANQLGALIDDLVNTTALAEFGRQSGMNVNKRLIDSDIANAPIFKDPVTGKFEQARFDAWLAQRRMSLAMLYSEQMRARYAQWLVNRSTLGAQLPNGVILPYASLALERRTGMVGFVQRNAMDAGPEPDDKTLTAFYTAHRNLYMVPERRVIRYSLVRPSTLSAGLAASDAEIADAYKKAGARFAAKEKRTIEVVTALDQASATTIANAAKAGTLDAAAKAGGLEVRKLDAVEKAAVTTQISAPFADAAFAAQQGALVGPVKLGPSWFVYRIANVESVAAKSLEQARTELATEIVERKTVLALVERRQAIEDGLGDDKTYDELVRDVKLVSQNTPLLAANGTDPLNPESKPDPALEPILRSGFTLEQGEEPQLVPVGQDGSFALVALERVVAAAPRPFAEVRAKVISDYLMDYRLKQARKAASDIANAVNKGTPMAEAFAKSGVTKGVILKPFDLQRSQIGSDNVMKLAFSIPGKNARIVAAPDNGGFYVVYVTAVQEKSAAGDAITLASARSALDQQIGPEYAQQFVRAIRNDVKVTRNEAAIKRLADDLTRTGGAN